MSKRKAREVAAEHGFSLTTKANKQEIIDVLDAAAAAAASGGLKGKFKALARDGNDDRFNTAWELRGPGGLMSILSFTVGGTRSGDSTKMDMGVVNFTYQKAPLPGMKPSLNGSKQLKRFNEIVKSQLQ